MKSKSCSYNKFWVSIRKVERVSSIISEKKDWCSRFGNNVIESHL